MSIRASGTHGPPRVKVRYRPSQYRRLLRDFLYGEDIAGEWLWTIPAPKGHPLPPSLRSLRGYAWSAGRAADAGRARLREVYQPEGPK
ncbi:hypothetical protein E3_0530 [Rhodococcus phage E3]|uniref:hypothetical protein n=1 Tax=Rhodococcus phage E3 TaxID=1007869 RepID=UPI0002C6E182|nr:hypothetical protein M176_gp057 [Rhodococcus phage E3]AEQ20967.1 hypothetical protein E3_0530 [Rhodococcus phage E3]